MVFNKSEMLKEQVTAHAKIQKIPRAEISHFEVELIKSEDEQNINCNEENKVTDEGLQEIDNKDR